MTSIKSKPLDMRGFTIVELMVATLVFSTILTVITAGVIAFSNHYYKGVNASATQNAAQTVLDTITQAFQFGAGQVDVDATTLSNGHFCAGGREFVFQKGVKFDGTIASTKGIFVAPMGAGCGPADIPSTGEELLAKNMRLTSFDIQYKGQNLYEVSLTVAYGDDDLICDASVSGDCSGSTTHTTAELSDMPNATCHYGSGLPFCATSRLVTSVQKRIN